MDNVWKFRASLSNKTTLPSILTCKTNFFGETPCHAFVPSKELLRKAKAAASAYNTEHSNNWVYVYFYWTTKAVWPTYNTRSSGGLTVVYLLVIWFTKKVYFLNFQVCFGAHSFYRFTVMWVYLCILSFSLPVLFCIPDITSCWLSDKFQHWFRCNFRIIKII